MTCKMFHSLHSRNRCRERLDGLCILRVVCTVWFHALVLNINQRGEAAQDKHTGLKYLSYKRKVTAASKRLTKQGAA